MIAYSPAKINIGLKILEKRPDGFHNLHSYLYPVPLYDLIEIQESNADELFQSGLISTSSKHDNLVYKALILLRDFIKIPPLKIHLHKQIPFQAGLGGGSGDAISFIKLVLQQFHQSLNNIQWQTITESLGSDCPFFIDAVPAEISGRGEIVQAINWNLKGVKVMIVKPDFPIKTADAFAEISTHQSKLPSITNLDLADYQEKLTNDFEDSLSKKFPELLEIKAKIIQSGAVYASLSGSGSAVFGLFYQDIKIHFPPSYFVWNGELQ